MVVGDFTFVTNNARDVRRMFACEPLNAGLIIVPQVVPARQRELFGFVLDEGEGLLRPQRTGSGYREYGPADDETVRRIKLLGSAGLTLGTIGQLLPCVQSNRPAFTPCDDLRRILGEQVDLLDERIETLSRSRTILAGFLSSASPTAAAPIETRAAARPRPRPAPA